MHRITTTLLAVVLVIGSVSAFPMAAAAQPDAPIAAIGAATPAQVNENASETAVNVTAGQRLSAVVGVGQAEFESEFELRAYGIEYASAASNDSKAEVVGERLATIEQRLADLKAQRATLEEARENGSISEGEYQARTTALAARTETVEQLANATEVRANELPAELLEAKGINVTAIQTLKQEAANLTGPEVAAIARTIAGPDVGQSITRGPPEDIGAPTDRSPDATERPADADASTAVERAAAKVDAAETRLDSVEARLGENASKNASEALEQAWDRLEQARTALTDARAALDAGDDAAAANSAERAIEHAEQALEHAQSALEATETADSDAGSAGGNNGSSGGY